MIRSTIFHIVYVLYVAFICVLCLPGLLLSKKQALYIVALFVHGVHVIERFVMGLDYEVRGRENLPASGAFIVAAKHESLYETTKLHILFYDPAVILKRELFRIPLWGKFLAKSEPIAIDRSKGRDAMAQIIEGAKRVAAEGRPIVIFPQGTRVGYRAGTERYPYKYGAVRMARATGLPIIPMATNSGAYWAKSAWRVRPGRVVFEFLPALPLAEDDVATTKLLEERLEAASSTLADEADRVLA